MDTSECNLVDSLPGRYINVARLAGDGEGGTWYAEEQGTGSRVVLKRVERGGSRLYRAFQLLRKSASPHLPVVVEWLGGAHGGAAESPKWLVTRWIDGTVLVPGPVEESRVVHEMAGVAHALQEIHRLGTHHGDVSAANVVITEDSKAVLTDLGLLGSLGSGTPGYLAPEVLAGGGGPAADFFSLGCLCCLRLFGLLPWVSPESLVRVRDRTQVRSRIVELEAQSSRTISVSLKNLLVRLLDPCAEARAVHGPEVGSFLEQLRDAGAIGGRQSSRLRWWPPSRWPYRGGDVGPAVGAIVAGKKKRPGLVAIAGAPGCGRGRVVEEIIQCVQSQIETGPEVALCGGENLAISLDETASSWIEGWLEGADSIVGVGDELVWPESLIQAQIRATILAEGAGHGVGTLVVSVDQKIAGHLEDMGSANVWVIHVRPWTRDEVREALVGVLEGGDIDAWITAFLDVSGGWPSTLLRAIEASAAARLEEPSSARIVAAMGSGGHRGLSPQQAYYLLELEWTGAAELRERIDANLLFRGRPQLWALAKARETFTNEELRETAQTFRDGRNECEQAICFGLALDAQDLPALEARLFELREGKGSEEFPTRLLEMLESDAASWLDDLSVGALEVVMDELVRVGSSVAVLQLSERRSDLDLGVFRARALQHLGRNDESMELLGSPRRGWEYGLRWRAMVDGGDAGPAWVEAQHWRDACEGGEVVDAERARDFSCAFLWGGFAAMRCGSSEADGFLCRALDVLGGVHDRESESLRARIYQLLANLAHAHGEGVAALDLYRRAGDAFSRAGESRGRVLLEASFAGVAYQMGELAEALRRGRLAIRGLTAIGLVQNLPAALFNLVQCLCLSRSLEEGVGYAAFVRTLCVTSGAMTPIDEGRLVRIDAELALAGLGKDRSLGCLRKVQNQMVDAATLLEKAGARREAGDAWLRATVCARQGGDSSRARSLLEFSRRCIDLNDGDVGLNLALCLEELAQASPGEAIGAATRALARLPGPTQLIARGEVLMAWFYDRGLLSALQREFSAKHHLCISVAIRQLRTLDLIMSKTTNLDSDAVRSSLLTESGDSESLSALVRSLEKDSANAELEDRASAPRQDSVSSVPDFEAQRLIRVFRRISREDQVERLLEQLVEAMMELTDAERGVVSVGEGEERVEVAREFSDHGDGVHYSRSILERVRKDGVPLISVDATADDRFDQSRSISHLNLRSVLAVPLCFRGKVLGAAYVDHRLRRGAFDENDLARLEDFAELAALGVAHSQALEAVRKQARQLATQQGELTALLEARDREVQGLREEVRRKTPERRNYRGMVGSSPEMQRIFRLVDRLSDSTVPVVIHGESGTGKELVAKAIHDAGPRATRPFIAENCGAIPETLLESVLFGHARGAFTGAATAKSGLFEAADRGTIFLDEIGEMSAAMQTKLLRVLQEGEVRRVGENRSRTIDVRLIAASNRDLEVLVENGQFREDLYYRIHVVKIVVPTLRDRREDISDLVHHFLSLHRGEHLTVSAAAMRRLTRYPWPGNIRELENEIRRWVALVEEHVQVEDLGSAIVAIDGEADDPDNLELRPRVERLEREVIARALHRTGGNQTQASGLLGLSRYGLQKKLRRLNREADEQ